MRFDNTPIMLQSLKENAERVLPHADIQALQYAENTSVYSFAAGAACHAGFLTPLAKIKIPFFGWPIYDSVIRTDMSVGDAEFQGSAPFYRLAAGSL